MDADRIRKEAETIGISSFNRQMLDYWLSLAGGAQPPLEAFDAGIVGDSLRACMLFDVVVGESVHCRIAGSVFSLAFGPDLAGRDWLAATPAPQRRQRLIRYSAVAQGGIGIGRREAVSPGDMTVRRIEEIMLPFLSRDGTSVPVLLHTDWRPEGGEWLGIDVAEAIILANNFTLIGLTAPCSPD